MDGGLPGPERNWKARGFRARLDTDEGYAGQFHVFHDTPAGVVFGGEEEAICPYASLEPRVHS